MTEPSPHDEEEKPDAEDRARPPSPPSRADWVEHVDPDATGDGGPPRPGARRPDWIVGAEEALEAEYKRPSATPERPATPIPPSAPHTPPRVNPYAGFAQSPAGKLSTSSWMDSGPATGATSSYTRPSPAPDDHGHQAPEPHESRGHGGPEAKYELPGHGAADAGTADDDLAGPETPGAATPAAAPPKPRRAAPPPPPPPPSSWWEPAVAWASSTTGLITIGVVAVLGLLIFMFTRPHQATVSVRSILHNATRLDGRTVTVHGRVGEVYPVGGGYSFYLMQGRDTIVVFTRTRTPVTDQKITVTGVISTGVLNGETREALLESAP